MGGCVALDEPLVSNGSLVAGGVYLAQIENPSWLPLVLQ